MKNSSNLYFYAVAQSFHTSISFSQIFSELLFFLIPISPSHFLHSTLISAPFPFHLFPYQFSLFLHSSHQLPHTVLLTTVHPLCHLPQTSRRIHAGPLPYSFNHVSSLIFPYLVASLSCLSFPVLLPLFISTLRTSPLYMSKPSRRHSSPITQSIFSSYYIS